jgi:hypothetical protein
MTFTSQFRNCGTQANVFLSYVVLCSSLSCPVAQNPTSILIKSSHRTGSSISNHSPSCDANIEVLAQGSENCSLSIVGNGGWLKAIIAGALLWVAISLAVIAHQPARAGSVVATIEIVLSLVVAIIACIILRW